MSDDTRNADSSHSVSSGQSKPRKNQGSAVLDRDGKPCRTCSSRAAFSSWASEAKKISELSESSSIKRSPRISLRDCPPDVEALGRSSWTLLHSITASYPEYPSSSQKSEVTQFLRLFAKLYPCWVCAEDFYAYIEKNRVRADSRQELGIWMCEAHNDVNKKLGKEIFDCNKWEERWRTGWKDGNCD